MPRSETRLFPALLRHWRTLRGLSQLDLALAADVSSRHVSFLETGRAQPSREMVLRLATTLSVPLREQNDLLRAAGFPDAFAEPGLEGGQPPGVAQAIDRMLAQQEPFPMTVLDRHYSVLRTNGGGTRLLARPFVVDWERVAHAFVSRLHRETLAKPADAGLAALLRSLFEYPDVPEAWRQPDFSTPSDPTLTLRL